MLRAHARKLHSLILSVDLLLAGAVFGAFAARSGAAASAGPGLLAMGLIGSLVWPLTLDQLGLYRSNRRSSLSRLLPPLLVAFAVSSSLAAAAGLLLGVRVAPFFPVACGLAQLAALSALRLGVFTALHALRRSGRNFRQVLIVGSGPLARHVRRRIERHPEWGQRIVGHVDDGDTAVDPELGSERVHKLIEFPALLREHAINEVILAVPRSMLAAIAPVVGVCARTGVPLTMLPDLFGDYLPPPRVTRFDSEAALSFAPVHHGRVRLAIKRGIDVVGAALLMVAGAPVLALAAAAIRLSSPGPAIFRQTRCGLHGRPFEMLKLRTMVVDAEARKQALAALNEMDGPAFKLRQDPRVTAVGRALRRWSIDELPQLWNVLRGDMSLVGPRPPVPSEVSAYETSQRRRLSMRPGITCIWQVSGRNTIGFADWVRLDVEYIDTWSLSGDFRLLLKTVPAVLRGTGAS